VKRSSHLIRRNVDPPRKLHIHKKTALHRDAASIFTSFSTADGSVFLRTKPKDLGR